MNFSDQEVNAIYGKKPPDKVTVNREMTDTEKVYGVDAVREIQRDFDVPVDIAKELHRIETFGEPTTVRTHDQVEADGQESVRFIRQTYTLEADRVSKKMAEIVARRPALRDRLNASGAGNSPALVAALAKTAYRELMQEDAKKGR